MDFLTCGWGKGEESLELCWQVEPAENVEY